MTVCYRPREKEVRSSGESLFVFNRENKEKL